MATIPRSTPDPRASAYLDALRRPPSARHVSALRERGIPIPASQAVASALLTDAIRREAVQR